MLLLMRMLIHSSFAGDAPGALHDLVVSPAAAANAAFVRAAPCGGGVGSGASALANASAGCAVYTGGGPIRFSTLGALTPYVPFELLVDSETSLPRRLDVSGANLSVVYSDWVLEAPDESAFAWVPDDPASACVPLDECMRMFTPPTPACVGEHCVCNAPVMLWALVAAVVGFSACLQLAKARGGRLAGVAVFGMFGVMMLSGMYHHSVLLTECGLQDPHADVYTFSVSLTSALTCSIALNLPLMALVENGWLADLWGERRSWLTAAAVLAIDGFCFRAAFADTYSIYVQSCLLGGGGFVVLQLVAFVRLGSWHGLWLLLLCGLAGAAGLAGLVVPRFACFISGIGGSFGATQAWWYACSDAAMALLWTFLAQRQARRAGKRGHRLEGGDDDAFEALLKAGGQSHL